jgi:hypothetical protein
MSGDFGPLASALPRLTRIDPAWSDGDGNCHAHGRWIGLFKLAEESGELTAAAADLLHLGGGMREGVPEFVRALENELADVGAACTHAIEANRLDAARVAGRQARQALNLERVALRSGRWLGLVDVIRACGAIGQLLGKIGAFPTGTEHPDGYGNLIGRLEVAVADLGAAATFVGERNGLDLDHIEMRGDDKLQIFRTWFPGAEAEGRP